MVKVKVNDRTKGTLNVSKKNENYDTENRKGRIDEINIKSNDESYGNSISNSKSNRKSTGRSLTKLSIRSKK